VTLKHTLPEVRARETARLGAVQWPQPFWPAGARSSYCVGWQTVQLGLRTGRESLAWLNAHPHMISIAAFRAHYQFPEVPAAAIAPGDLVISNWTGARVDGDLEAEHMEWAYSHNRAAAALVVVGANTGPAAGRATPNGIWKKSRPRDGHILFGIRPPYAGEKAPSRSRKHEVAVVAAWVNDPKHVPGKLALTTAAPGVGPDSDTGREGRNYWVRVQTWGRNHGYYGSRFDIDGIPGPQSRIVEAAAYKAATAKK
jgi:hypothetical protein